MDSVHFGWLGPPGEMVRLAVVAGAWAKAPVATIEVPTSCIG